MKKKIIGIISLYIIFYIILILVFTGCSEPSYGDLTAWRPGTNQNNSSVPLRAITIAPDISDPEKIIELDSYTDGDYNYYLIHGGIIDNILIAVMQEVHYNGITPMSSSATTTTTNTITDLITETAMNSFESTNIQKASVSTSASAGLGKFKAKAEAKWEGEWIEKTYYAVSTTTSTERALSVAESRSVSFTVGNNGEPAGWYRYSLYATADLVFYIKTCINNKELLELESIIGVRNNSHFPYFEYSPIFNFDNTPEYKLSLPSDFWTKLASPKADFSKYFINRISAGDDYSLVIDKDGQLWAWGHNTQGQTGIGNTNHPRITPIHVLTDKTFKFVEAGYHSSYAIDTNGNLWAWGRNNAGQLGDGSTSNKLSPVLIRPETKFIAISASSSTPKAGYAAGNVWSSHCLAIDELGNLWAWGQNDFGQLGDGTTIQRNSPVQIRPGTTFKEISAGPGHSLAIDSDGNLLVWGRNNNGQLGDGTTTNRLIPVVIKPDTKFKSISAGGYDNGTTGGLTSTIIMQCFSLAIDEDGNLWAWGNNSFGQIGNGNRSQQNSPVQIMTGIEFKVISAGLFHGTAIDTDNNLWVWGRNSNYRQLGTGNTTDSLSPRKTARDDLFLYYISASAHNLAIDRNRRLYVWGYNNSGQLGFNDMNLRDIPHWLTDNRIQF
ncbi:MAG: hypothetical protein FWD47_04255 [Treponema sp.]|nr:hypothetical protein [Treponema sp.]